MMAAAKTCWHGEPVGRTKFAIGAPAGLRPPPYDAMTLRNVRAKISGAGYQRARRYGGLSGASCFLRELRVNPVRRDRNALGSAFLAVWMPQMPKSLVGRDEAFHVAPAGSVRRQRPTCQHHLQHMQKLFRHFQIALVAGVMKGNQNFVR